MPSWTPLLVTLYPLPDRWSPSWFLTTYPDRLMEQLDVELLLITEEASDWIEEQISWANEHEGLLRKEIKELAVSVLNFIKATPGHVGIFFNERAYRERYDTPFLVAFLDAVYLEGEIEVFRFPEGANQLIPVDYTYDPDRMMRFDTGDCESCGENFRECGCEDI